MHTRSGWALALKSAALAGVAALLCSLGGTLASAQETIRIGLPTKTYYPTIIAETALRQGLFAKEGIKAELTIYRSGGETFEAGAAGAADLQLNSAALIGAGRKKGVMTKAVAGAALGYYGWYLMVKTDSKITSVAELEGKKVGITAAGSGSDLLALWTMQSKKLKFTNVPLGGGGLVPNMLSGNVDAVVLYSPLSFKMMLEKQGRSLLDFGASVEPHLSGLWIASDKFIAEKPQVRAEGAQRALWRARLPAGQVQPRRGRQDDRRDRRHPGQRGGGRARRQPHEAVDHRRDERGVDVARTGSGAARRHDRSGAGRRRPFVTSFRPVPTKK